MLFIKTRKHNHDLINSHLLVLLWFERPGDEKTCYWILLNYWTEHSWAGGEALPLCESREKLVIFLDSKSQIAPPCDRAPDPDRALPPAVPEQREAEWCTDFQPCTRVGGGHWLASLYWLTVLRENSSHCTVYLTIFSNWETFPL